MAIDPSIALGVRPPAIPVPEIQTPLDRFAKVLSLRNMMTQGESGQLGLQSKQLEFQQLQQQMQDEAKLRQLYTTNPNPTQADIISTIGPQRAIPLLKAQNEQYEQQLKTNAQKAARLGQIAGSIVDPQSYQNGIMTAVGERLLDPEAGRQLAALNWDDPKTQAQVRQFQQQALTAEQQHNAQLADAQAKRQQLESEARLPGLQAESTAKVRQMDANTLAPAMAKGPDAFQAALAQLPPERQAIFRDATTPMEIYRRAQTPEQVVTSSQQAIAQTETARHNQRVEELTGQGHTQQQATALANVEGKLRDDFNQATKTFPTIREAYGRIQAAKSAPPSGASDIALLYGYMKVLDPGSTVREGEFATASNAGGIPDRIMSLYNRILRGDRLSPNVRAEMFDNVNRLYDRATADYDKTRQQFTDISKRSGADPRNVVIDYTTTAPTGTAAATGTGEAPAGSTPALKVSKPGDEPKMIWIGPDGKEYDKPPAVKTSPGTTPATNPNPKGYVPGHVYGGMTYLGGDPNNRASWR